MWMDLPALVLFQSSTKEYDGSPTNAKYKCFIKNKIQLATASDATTIHQRYATCELVALPSWHCYRNPDTLDPWLRLVPNVR